MSWIVSLLLNVVPIWSLIDTAPSVQHIDKERQHMITHCYQISTSDFEERYELTCK